MREGFPLLVALFRARVRMFRNRVGQSSWAERIGATALVATFPLFWFLVGGFLFRDPDFLFGLVRSLGLSALNRITLSLIQTAFLVVILVGVQEEIDHLFRAQETDFLLGFPHPGWAFYAWRLGLSTLRVLVAVTIGLPVLLIYLHYFYRSLALWPFLGMVFLLGSMLLLGGLFLGAVVQLLAGVLSALLIRVSQTRIIVGGLGLYSVAAWMTLRPLVEQARQSDLLAVGKAMSQSGESWWEAFWLWLPPARFLAALEVVDHGDLLRCGQALGTGLVGLTLAVWLSGLVVRVFCLDDAGSLREQAQSQQGRTGSDDYGWFLSRMPAFDRGLLFEERAFFRRRYWFNFWLLVVPTTLAPLLAPPRFLALLAGGNEAGMLAVHGVVGLLLLVDFVMADFTEKTDLLPLLVTQPVDLQRYFATKAMIYGDITLGLLFIIFGVWAWILPFSGSAILACLMGILVMGYSFSWTTLGLYAGGMALSSQPCSMGSERGRLTIVSFVTVGTTMAVGTLLVGAVIYRLPGVALGILGLWGLASRFAFNHGTRLLIARLEQGD